MRVPKLRALCLRVPDARKEGNNGCQYGNKTYAETKPLFSAFEKEHLVHIRNASLVKQKAFVMQE